MRASSGAVVKLCLGDLLVMGSNPETTSLHMQVSFFFTSQLTLGHNMLSHNSQVSSSIFLSIFYIYSFIWEWELGGS